MNGPGLRALVLGGSGEIGRQLVQELINSPGFSHITLVTRRELDVKSEKVEQKLVDFENLDNHIDAFKDVQVCLSICLHMPLILEYLLCYPEISLCLF